MQGSPFQGLTGIGQSLSSKPSALPGIGSISTSISSPSNVTEEQGKTFSGMLANSMGEVNKSMNAAKNMTGALLTGRLDNLHEMTIAGAKSEVMMKLTTSITGKLAQATTQLFQMQL